MSDTPRNDDTPEYRDPTAPSDPTTPSDSSSSEDSGTSGGSFDLTSPIETNQTQEVPPIPSSPSAPSPAPTYAAPPAAPGAQPTGQPAYGPPPGAAQQNPYAAPPAGAGAPPPPHNPYASAPGAGQPNPYAGQQYPTQGQVQGGYTGAPAYGTPGYGTPTYGQSRGNNGSAIALTAVSGVLLLISCGGAFLASIPGLVMGIIGITKYSTDPVGAARITKIGWFVFGGMLLLSILAFVALMMAGFAMDSGSSFDSGY